jgi:competence protein ComEC
MKRPALFLAISYLAGIIAGRELSMPPLFFFASAVLAVIIGVIVFLRIHLVHSDTGRLRRHVAMCLLAALFLIAAAQQRIIEKGDQDARSFIQQNADGRVITVDGNVAGRPEWHGQDNPRLVLVLNNVTIRPNQKDQPEAISFNRRLQISLIGNGANVFLTETPLVGQAYRFQCRLRPVDDQTGQTLFDYDLYLMKRGIAGQANVWRPDALVRRSQFDINWKTRLLGPIQRWREKTASRIDSALSNDNTSVMRAVLLGDTSRLHWSTREIFARAGMAHLLAVSGLHTAMLAAMIYLVLRLLLIPPRWSALAMLVALGLYCILTGFRPPVLRASFLAFCATLPLITGRRTDILNALCLAAFLTMIVNPRAPLRIDFQLSYVACIGLILLYPSIHESLLIPTRRPSTRTARLARLWNIFGARFIAVSLAVQIALLPFLSHIFARISLVGFLSNAVTIPWAAFVLASGWAFALLGELAPALGALTAYIADFAAGIQLHAARFLSMPTWAAIRVPAFPWWLCVLYYVFVFSGPIILRRRAPGSFEIRRSAAWLRIALVTAILVWWTPLSDTLRRAPGNSFPLEVIALDVGQGDSILIRSGQHHNILVDTGPDGASRKVLQWLWHNGIDAIDALIITHNDADHMGAADELVNTIYIKKILTGPLRADTNAQSDLERAIQTHQTPVEHAVRGDSIKLPNNTLITILHPLANTSDTSRNEQSIVLKIQNGDIDFLLTGDATKKTEKELIDAFGPGLLDIEILKVAHHGSRHSTSQPFLLATTPQIAIISAGKNAYGHPHSELLQRLKSAKSTIYTTPRHGNIRIATEGKKIYISTENPDMSQDHERFE